jgi:hypothetical protein
MGFYSRVDDKLLAMFPDEIKSGHLVLVGSPSGKRMQELKMRVTSALSQNTDKRVMILFAKIRGEDWVEARVQELVTTTQGKFAGCTIDCRAFENALDDADVMVILEQIGLASNQNEIGAEKLEAYLAGRTILFVRSPNDTALDAALERAGIVSGALRSCFEERIIDPGKNSNLNGDLSDCANKSKILLYVWKRLRTLKSDTKRKFAHAIEGDSSAKVIGLLRKELDSAQ